MSEAYKCDLCGKLLESTVQRGRFITIDTKDGSSLSLVISIDRPGVSTPKLDLCVSCCLTILDMAVEVFGR